MRCEDYFQTWKCFERRSLSGDLEQTLDEPRLPLGITSGQPFDLTLPHHVYRFNAFERALGGVKTLEAL
jgi:hypothetical protein